MRSDELDRETMRGTFFGLPTTNARASEAASFPFPEYLPCPLLGEEHIGMRLEPSEGDVQQLFWWRNMEVHAPTEWQLKRYLATYAARIKMGWNVQVSYGFGVDRLLSSVSEEGVSVDMRPNVLGVYIASAEGQGSVAPQSLLGQRLPYPHEYQPVPGKDPGNKILQSRAFEMAFDEAHDALPF